MPTNDVPARIAARPKARSCVTTTRPSWETARSRRAPSDRPTRLFLGRCMDVSAASIEDQPRRRVRCFHR